MRRKIKVPYKSTPQVNSMLSFEIRIIVLRELSHLPTTPRNFNANITRFLIARLCCFKECRNLRRLKISGCGWITCLFSQNHIFISPRAFIFIVLVISPSSKHQSFPLFFFLYYCRNLNGKSECTRCHSRILNAYLVFVIGVTRK